MSSINDNVSEAAKRAAQELNIHAAPHIVEEENRKKGKRRSRFWYISLIVLFSLHVLIGNSILWVKKRSGHIGSQIALNSNGVDTLLLLRKQSVTKTTGKFTNVLDSNLPRNQIMVLFPEGSKGVTLMSLPDYEDRINKTSFGSVCDFLFVNPVIAYTLTDKVFDNPLIFSFNSEIRYYGSEVKINTEQPMFFNMNRSGIGGVYYELNQRILDSVKSK